MTAAASAAAVAAKSWHCDRVSGRKGAVECKEAAGSDAGLCVRIAIKILSRNAPRFWAALRGLLINVVLVVVAFVVTAVVIALVIVAAAFAVAIADVVVSRLLLPPGRRRCRSRRCC